MSPAPFAAGAVQADSSINPINSDAPARATLAGRLLAYGWVWAALLAFAAYWPALGYRYTLDDFAMVEHNTRIRRLENPASYLLTDWWNVGADRSLYRPLTLATFALEYAVWKVDPRAEHFDNNLLHALDTALVWVLADMLLAAGGARHGQARLAATAGAILFAVHPVHVEAVAGIVGRNELMMTAGYLAALIAAIRSARGADARSRWGWAALGVLPAALIASGSKEHGATLPAAIALLSIEPLLLAGAFVAPLASSPARTGETIRRWLARMRRLAPALACSVLAVAAYLALRRIAIGAFFKPAGYQVHSGLNPLVVLAGFQRACGDLAVLALAVRMLFVPLNPSPQYGFAVYTPEMLASTSAAAVHAAVFLAAIAVLWVFRRRPILIVSLGFFAVSMALASNTIITIDTLLGERLLYLPSAFVCLAVAGLVAGSTGRRSKLAAFAAIGLWIVALSVLHARYLPVWRDQTTLMAYALQRAPESVNLLGIAAGEAAWEDDYAKALDYVNEVVRLDQKFPEGEKAAIALRDLLVARKTVPGTSDPHKRFHQDFQSGVRLVREQARLWTGFGNPQRAERILREAAARNPEATETQVSLGEWLCGQHRLDEAEAAYRKACEIDPLDDACWTQLAYFFVKDRPDPEKAIAAAMKALALYPGEPNAVYVLNQAYALERARAAADGKLKTEIQAADSPAR